MNLGDLWLAAVSSIFAPCCLVVIALTAIKRVLHRRTGTHIGMTPVLEG